MAQNIFQAHAEALGMYQAETVVNAQPGGGTVNFIDQKPMPATIQPFEQKQILRMDGGGFSPSLRGMVLIDKTYLPSDGNIRTGYRMTVTQPFGIVRQCQIVEWTDKYTFWEIVVEDISQNA